MNEIDETRTAELQRAIQIALNDALADGAEEILLNQWVFVVDVLVDGTRCIIPVWDDGMDPIDVEAMLAPAYRMSKDITNSTVIGMNAKYLDTPGILSMANEPEEDEDETDDDD